MLFAWEYKDYMGYEKGLLRCAMKGVVPDEILRRKKSPYPKTFDPRFSQLAEERFRMLLADLKAPLWHVVRRDSAEQLLTSEHTWPWYGQLMRGTQTMIYLLQTDFWLRHYGIKFAF